MGWEKIKGDSHLESIIFIFNKNPSNLFEAIPLRSDGVMFIKPFTFNIWGKPLLLLIGSIPRSYYTLQKGIIHTSPMQLT